MAFWNEIKLDILAVNAAPVRVITCNRGFQALLFYRIAHRLQEWGVPLFPLILTRIMIILYGIELDPKAEIAGGCEIIHGIGLVVGWGAKIGPGCKLFHGVTLGIVDFDWDGDFPLLEEGVIVGAGAKLLGRIRIGKGAKIGANAVVLKDVPAGSVAVGVPAKIIEDRIKAI
ncbi:MAG: serine O-acetyltransferase [Candidatus Caenarcaniphilales bacterium]|nr:serine O-acetyltransferase [Candidatus Caenarcaniphilales bacterium]